MKKNRREPEEPRFKLDGVGYGGAGRHPALAAHKRLGLGERL